MNESDQRVCDQRHDHIDFELGRIESEIKRVRERLDGNGSVGLCARLKSIEDHMPDWTELQRSVRTLSAMLVLLALLVGADVALKAAPLLRLVIP